MLFFLLFRKTYLKQKHFFYYAIFLIFRNTYLKINIL